MTGRDFERVKMMLKSVYPRIEYLDNQDTAGVFFNILNRYDFGDVWQGVKNLVEIERYAPTISTVEQYVKDAQRIRRDEIMRMSAPERDSMTVKCPKCNDAGFVWVTYKDGTEVARICDCETARKENPWAFMTDKEYEAAHDEQKKRGQNPPTGKPGHPTEWWVEQCGEAVSISPGKRPPDKKMKR